MSGETVDSRDDSFVAVAVRHGLLQLQHVDKIISHAEEIGVQPSDAALTLSMLEFHEVDAINLLCRPTELAPGFVLTGLIGCGAGGLVFKANQTAMDRDVALKTINVRSLHASTTGQSRIQRESLAIARLHHPHIVTAFDSGFHQGRFCIAMELVDGETLADLIERRSTISETVTWHIARQVASALAHANDAGITHRDIKPANLLLCETPQGMSLPVGVPFVKVADFGLALQAGDRTDSQLTATGTTLGTPAYVAPEQLRDTHVDARADIYSLGATVFHMLIGSPPCSDRSPMRTIMQKTIGDDRWRDELPPSISRSTISLFRDMTETNPDDRISDYQDLIDRIDDLLAEAVVPPAKTATSMPASGRRICNPRRRRPMVRRALSIVSVALLFIGLGALAMGFARRNSAANNVIGPAARWQVNGLPAPLFNGKSVPLFRQSGSWALGIAGDGSRVLKGMEGAQMTIPLMLETSTGGTDADDFRLRVGVLVSVDNRAEIRLLSSSSGKEFAVLRFDSSSVKFIPDASATNASRTTAARSIDLQTTSIDDSVIQRVSLQRAGDQVSLFINGDEIGRVACGDNTIDSAVLRCVKNESSFADIDIVSITPMP